ncbi:MAG: OadG family protein [Oscillospiraceae bacterium]|nr:OadG family protein [Oscillospiraceae bacterium]
MEYPVLFVCLLGIATVFVGLVCIVLLCSVVSFVCSKLFSGKKQKIQSAPAVTAPVKTLDIPNRKKVLAAVCAVIAEENGCDVSAIRVKSFKKI